MNKRAYAQPVTRRECLRLARAALAISVTGLLDLRNALAQARV